MREKSSITCQLAPNRAQQAIIEATLEAFAAACSRAVDVGRQAGTTGNARIHHLCYRELRQRYGLSANLTVRVIARAAALLKAPHEQEPATSQIDYDARVLSISTSDWTVSLSTIRGRLKGVRMELGPEQRLLLGGRDIVHACLTRSAPNAYSITFYTREYSNP